MKIPLLHMTTLPENSLWRGREGDNWRSQENWGFFIASKIRESRACLSAHHTRQYEKGRREGCFDSVELGMGEEDVVDVCNGPRKVPEKLW